MWTSGNVAGSSSRNVVRYDLVTGLLVDTFVESESGGLNAPWGIAFGPDAHLYIVDRDVGAVRRYDGETGAYIDEFVAAGSGGLFDATGLVFHPSGDRTFLEFPLVEIAMRISFSLPNPSICLEKIL